MTGSEPKGSDPAAFLWLGVARWRVPRAGTRPAFRRWPSWRVPRAGTRPAFRRRPNASPSAPLSGPSRISARLRRSRGGAARCDRARYVGFMREVIRAALGDDGSQQYVLERDGDCVGRLRYRGAPEAVLDILHVWVDPALRGGRLGQRLVDHAAQQVRAAGGRITATCGFARSVLARDPEQRDLVL